MGFIVDKPKSGYENSNNGNTARRFFKNPKMNGQITGLDVNLNKVQVFTKNVVHRVRH